MLSSPNARKCRRRDERSQLIAKPRSGPEAERAEAEDSEQLRHVTIAIAAGNLLVRLDGFAVPSDSAAITQAVVAMAHSLGMKVTAEGVETEAQASFLREIGCDRQQGFLFSQPLEPDAYARRLGDRWRAAARRRARAGRADARQGCRSGGGVLRRASVAARA